jgi:leukotriene-A4 hydrolase
MSFSTAFASPIDKDPSTKSNYLSILTTHIDLSWTINWNTKLIHGSALLKMKVTAKEGVKEIVLDASHLNVESVEIDEKEKKWEFGDRIEVIGEGLYIHLGEVVEEGKEVEVLVKYSTTKECTAVGWLEPR